MIYPWQLTQLNQVMQTWHQGSMPQALLFTGLKGVGKVEFAQHIAQFILCQQRTEVYCGQCRDCNLFAAGSHPDFYFVRLLEKSKVIKIDQIRKLTGQLNQTAQSEYQVALIAPANQMNTAAMNALLKTLEEPSGKVLIMLCAQQASLLPATITSRCQRIDFQINEPESAIDWLASTYQDEDAELLFRQTHRAPLLADELLNSQYFSLRDEVFSLMRLAILEGKNPLPNIAGMIKKSPERVLRAMISLVSDCIRVNMRVDSQYITNLDIVDKLKALQPLLLPIPLMNFYCQCVLANHQLNQGVHVNVQLLFESLFIDWMNIKK